MNSFNRLIFVIQTKIKVAMLNYNIEHSFKPYQGANPKALVAVVTAVLILTLTGIVAGKNFFVGESTASIATATVAEPTVPPSAPFLEPIQPSALEEPPMPEITAFPPHEDGQFMLAVDKASRTMFILRDAADHFEVVTSFPVSMGKADGRKKYQGDLKTPEGLYRIVEIKEKAELDRIYGPRAFVLNYPNEYDVASGRTGGGIWIHGSGLGNRTPDTKGCVELDDQKIIDLSRWADVNTPIAIFPESFPIPLVQGKLAKRYASERFIYSDVLASSSS